MFTKVDHKKRREGVKYNFLKTRFVAYKKTLNSLESYKARKLYFPFHTKVDETKAREAENLAQKLEKYRKIRPRTGSLILYKITKYLAVAIRLWN